MGWGQALRAMLGPALLTRPVLGLVGGLVLIAITAAAGERAGAGILVLFAVFGAGFGLVVATPAALIAGTPMVRLAASDPRWATRRAWAASGTAVGGAIGALFGLSIEEDVAALLVASAFAAALGLLGALLCHRMVARKIAARTAVDLDIFA